MLHDAKVTALTVSELLRETNREQGGGEGKIRLKKCAKYLHVTTCGSKEFNLYAENNKKSILKDSAIF